MMYYHRFFYKAAYNVAEMISTSKRDKCINALLI